MAFELVIDGAPRAVIVLPQRTEYDDYLTTADPVAAELARAVGDEERLAAQELQEIIERITGAHLPIVVSGDVIAGSAQIHLGAVLARAAGCGARIDALHRDGLLCTVQGELLILAGRRARGTLYAVYEFLESLGCRWTMPGPFGEMYPTLTTIATNIDKVANPSHDQRYWWTHGDGDGYARWTLRTKGNHQKAIGDQVIYQNHALAQPLKWAARQEQYGAASTGDEPLLPDEYYALQNGQPAKHTPNLSNPKVWDLYAAYYIDHFNRNPHIDYASISAEDGFVIDERPASRQLDSKEYDWVSGSYTATDALWFFHQRVIEKVARVHPTKKFGVLVYANNMTPPRVQHVHPRTALVIAPLSICPLHHVRDERCKTNRVYAQWLPAWLAQARAVGAESYYYDYEPLGFCWNMAMLCPRWGIIGRNYPWFHEMGLTGHTTEGYDDWAACGLNNYVMQRLYWDATQDYRDIVADYARARFGAAAPAMLDYYGIYEKRMEEIPDLYQNEVWDNHLVLTPAVRAAAREALASAAQAAGTARERAQVAAMVEVQRSTDAACDAIEHADATGDFGAAAQMMETVFQVRDRLNQHYSHFMNPLRVDEKQKAQFHTGGIYNQYRGFDEKIKAAPASLLLPRIWNGMLDTDNRASLAGYHRPEMAVDALDDLDVTLCPDVVYKTEREVAAFFYRTEVAVPAAFAGRTTSLYFASIIAKNLQIWVNGEAVAFDYGDYKDTVWRGPDYFWFNYNHEQEFDITPHLRPGERNTIAFRVMKSFDFGGSYRRIWLLGR